MSTKKFQRERALILPTISLKKMLKGESRFYQSLGEVTEKPDLDKKGDQKIDPETGKEMFIHLLEVTDLETGESGEIVLGFMVRKALGKVEKLEGFKFEMLKGGTKNRTTEWTVYPLK